MAWFRWKRRAAPEESEEAPEPVAPEVEPKSEAQPRPPSRPKSSQRRPRGSRGGRANPKRTGESKPSASAGEPRKKTEEKLRARSRRGRAAPKTDRTPAKRPSPSVKKKILVSVDVGEQRVAVLEDEKPAEVYLERPDRRSIAGNIYRGIVDNVLPGMEAAFVDIGLERNGFLYVDEIVVPELEGKRGSRRIQELIQRGEEILVQTVKDPMGAKGARLTTEISLPGRFLVLAPFGEGIGVSRRLDDDERNRLKELTKALDLPEGGVIVRTAAEGATASELKGDLAFLQKLWTTIQGRAKRVQAPSIVYQESELPLRSVRDLFIRDFERVIVDHDRTYRRIVSYLKRTSPELAARIELYEGSPPLMERFGVEEAIDSTLHRRVDLPSGGYLIFDYAEAFTVIDVNTGRFVGGRGKTSPGRLEDTITKNNLEAVAEVVRQLRLRDIGGIIVIDFIDMANPKNRELVEAALETELERDRTKTYVVEISPLGLVEMTRQNVTDGPREILTDTCPACHGDGVTLSAETHAIALERELRRRVAEAKSEAFRVEVNTQVADLLSGPGGERISALEEETSRRFILEGADDVPLDHLKIRARGRYSRIGPKDLPVDPGQELMAKLEEPHPQNEEDALVRLDGYPIAVAGAGDKVGRRMKIRIERAHEKSAYAVLARKRKAVVPVQAVDIDEDPIDEKPKKSGRRRSGRKRAEKKDNAAATSAETNAKADAKVVAAEAKPETKAAAVTETKPKKKTRRGSRGGRGRKKKTADQAVEQADGTIQSTDGKVNESSAKGSQNPAKKKSKAPKNSSTADDGSESESDGAQPRKRTRRGSRGGRGRRRKATNGSAPETDGQKPPTTDGKQAPGDAIQRTR